MEPPYGAANCKSKAYNVNVSCLSGMKFELVYKIRQILQAFYYDKQFTTCFVFAV